MAHLAERGLVGPLNERVLKDRMPVLGICLGMQLLTQGSEEGKAEGLGWIRAHTVRFRFEGKEQSLRIPHMGWNLVRPLRRHPLFEDLETEARFYFVHSYHVVPDSPDPSLATTSYGIDFVSAIADENVMGVQFHPEKSHKFGMNLLKNFVENC